MTRFTSAVLALLISLPAFADEEGNAWLTRIDKAAEVSDVHMNLTLQVTDASGKTSVRGIEIWQKGTDKRLVRLVSPARLKGVGLLVGAKESLHLFLPSYPPSRRVVGSKRSDAFMGTDFAMEDLSRMSYGGRFEAVVAGEEGSLTKLTLTPIEDNSDTRVHLWVASSGVPVVHQIDHVDAGGITTRRLKMHDFRDVSGSLIAHQLQVEDLSRGRATAAQVTSVEIGSGLHDRIFTVTHLEHP